MGSADFYSMTVSEAQLAAEAWRLREYKTWDMARRIISATENSGIIARGTKITPNMITRPEHIIRLPWDRERNKVSKKDLEKPSQELRDLARKHGLINKKNKSKSLSEILTKNKAS